MKKFRYFFSRFILIQLGISIIISAFLLFYTLNRIEVKTEELKINEQASLRIVKNFIQEALIQIFADLSYTNDIVVHHLNHPETDAFDKLNKNLVYFSSRKNIYDQIRYLDQNGMEIIRINKNN